MLPSEQSLERSPTRQFPLAEITKPGPPGITDIRGITGNLPGAPGSAGGRQARVVFVAYFTGAGISFASRKLHQPAGVTIRLVRL